MHKQRGNALIEAAFILPILILVLLGIFEVGRAWMSYNLLQYAVREGARLATVRPGLRQNDPVVIRRINDTLLLGGLTAVQPQVIYASPLQTGTLVRVRATVNFVPIVSIVFPGGVTIPLRVEEVTRYEV